MKHSKQILIYWNVAQSSVICERSPVALYAVFRAAQGQPDSKQKPCGAAIFRGFLGLARHPGEEGDVGTFGHEALDPMKSVDRAAKLKKHVAAFFEDLQDLHRKS